MLLFESVEHIILQFCPSMTPLTGDGDGCGYTGSGPYLDETFNLIVVDIVCGPFRYGPLVESVTEFHVVDQVSHLPRWKVLR